MMKRLYASSYFGHRHHVGLRRNHSKPIPAHGVVYRALADPGMDGPGAPHGPNIGVFFNLNTKLLAIFV